MKKSRYGERIFLGVILLGFLVVLFSLPGSVFWLSCLMPSISSLLKAIFPYAAAIGSEISTLPGSGPATAHPPPT